MGPKVKEGKNAKAATIKMMAKTILPKVAVSVAKVPEPSGTKCFFANNPAIATGPIIGKNRPKINTKPVAIFQNGVLSPNPSKPEPLFAADEVNSYNISLNP